MHVWARSGIVNSLNSNLKKKIGTIVFYVLINSTNKKKEKWRGFKLSSIVIVSLVWSKKMGG